MNNTDTTINEKGLSVILKPTFEFIKDYWRPCANLQIYYNGEPVNVEDTYCSYYFDGNPVKAFFDVINPTSGNHVFMVSVTYKSETKIVEEIHYFSRVEPDRTINAFNEKSFYIPSEVEKAANKLGKHHNDPSMQYISRKGFPLETSDIGRVYYTNIIYSVNPNLETIEGFKVCKLPNTHSVNTISYYIYKIISNTFNEEKFYMYRTFNSVLINRVDLNNKLFYNLPDTPDTIIIICKNNKWYSNLYNNSIEIQRTKKSHNKHTGIWTKYWKSYKNINIIENIATNNVNSNSSRILYNLIKYNSPYRPILRIRYKTNRGNVSKFICYKIINCDNIKNIYKGVILKRCR